MAVNKNLGLHRVLLLIVVASIQISLSEALLEGIYCGKENCYDVLGVTREETSKSEIAKKYRALAKKFHPDMHRSPDAKAEAEVRFKQIATAYEILKDDESRTDYDYMLDNPEDYYRHYYRYYRNRVAPKVDVRIVLIVTISIISAVQYYSANQRYEIAINYFMQQPKYRNRALDVARERGAYDDNNTKKGAKKKNKQEIKEETERVIRKVLEENMDIRGGYAKPKVSDILWIQLILLPYTIVAYFVWYASWTWRFNIKKEPYGEEEKLYLIRRNMKLGQYQFDAIEEPEKKEFLRRELWLKENYDAWHEEKEEEMKVKLAESAKHKAYRRYLKVHGEGRMTFDDS